MTAREWRSIDYYAVLGVRPDASQDEIAATYRILAKTLHPDARPGDPAAGERFKRVAGAYRVLGNTDTRRRYDAYRLAQRYKPRVAPGAFSTRRGARWAIVGGIACIVTGAVVAGLVVSLQRHDAALRSRGRPATATVVEVEGERRFQFTTASGQKIIAPQSVRTGTGEPRIGSKVHIRYDTEHPTRVVTTDDTTARDVTLWIVAAKLLLVGVFFVGFGARRLRRAPAP